MNKVEIVVVAKDNTGAVFDSIEAKAKTAGEKAGKAAGDGIKDGVDESTKDLGTDAGKNIKDGIEKELGSTNGSGLESAVRNSGQKAAAAGKEVGESVGREINDGIDRALSNDTGGGNGLISRLKSMAGEVGEASKAIGTTIAQNIGSAFSDGGGAIKTGLIAGLVLGGTAAAPFLISAIAGAIGATTVLGTVVAGAILAFENDPRLQDAGKALGEKLFGSLKNDSNVFAEPILAAIASISAGFDEIEPKIANIFANGADLVGPFVNSIINGLQEIIEGIDNLVAKAGPDLLAGLGAGFEEFSASIADLFDTMAEHGEELGTALQAAFNVLAEAIDIVSTAVGIAADVWGTLVDVMEKAHELAGDDQGPITGEWVENVQSGADALDAMAGAADKAVQSNQNLADQLLASTDPIFAVIDSQKKLIEAGDKYDAAVKKWGPDSQQAADALVNVEKAAVRATKAGLDLGDAATTGWTPQLQAAAEAAGLDADVIATLRDYFNQAYDAGKKMAQTYAVKVQTTGIDGAIQGLAGVKAAVDAIPDQKLVYIGTIGPGVAGAIGKASGGSIGAAATGGVRGNMVLVGEQGPEIVKLPVGSTVFPHGQSKNMMSDAAHEDAIAQQQMRGGSMDSDAIVSELREMRKAFMAMKLYVNERAIGGLQGYEADILGRAG